MIAKKPFCHNTNNRGGEKKVLHILGALAIVLSISAQTQLQAQEVPLDIEADNLTVDKSTNDMSASGNVIIEQKGLFTLKADEAQYDGEDETLSAKGSVKLSHKQDIFFSDSIYLDFANEEGEMVNSTMDMEGFGGRGGAQLVVLTDKKTLEMDEGWYTNCECDDPAWHITAKTIVVDRDANNVTAKGMKLYIKNTQVAWLPMWSQALRPERKSGFLTPKFRFSGSNGFELETPYYWNIAPDKDMTIAPRSISKRGTMGKAEYRYIGHGYQGQFNTNLIHDEFENQDRGLTTFSHNHRKWGWDISVAGKYSKTRDFINDFEQDLVDNNSRRLESHILLDRQWIRDDGYLDVQTGMLWYQDLEQSNDKFTIQSLPYIYAFDSRPLSDLEYGKSWRLQSDIRIDNFFQLSGDSVQRLDLAPTIHYNKPVHVGNLSAQMGVRETTYVIQGDPNQAGVDYESTEHREAANISVRLDSKLSKRVMGSRQHTIEPSIEYVANITTDQSMLPNYDSTLRNLSTSNLFMSNQYSGTDRISEGQWISYGITSRLISLVEHNSLMETATFKIGQRWAPPGDREDFSGYATSDIVSSLDLNFTGGWSAHTSNRYNPHDQEIMRTDANVTYVNKKGNHISMGYHFNQPSTVALVEDSSERSEDITLSAGVRTSNNWHYTQKAAYSLENSQIKSWATVLEYVDSCWSLGIKLGNNLSTDSANSDYNGNYFGFIFTLKGLGGYGT
ncbi:MAG: LPS-assembly protein LptD [Magnetococcales bacterium]|nr:LPS-assembly protein LptD [Magnetococcales bacterium]